MKQILKPASKIILGVFLFVGLPWIGWGIGDFAGLVENTARLTYVIVAVVMQISIVILYPQVGAGRQRGVTTVARQKVAIVIFQVLGLAIMILAPYCDRRDILVMGQSNVLRVIGVALFLLGMAGTTWAEATLGKLFSTEVTIQAEHTLITSGPFHFIRHPRYLGIIMLNLGFSLAFRSWLAVALTALFVCVLLWRISDEEKLMAATFGDEWRSYCRGTSRLIPFVY